MTSDDKFGEAIDRHWKAALTIGLLIAISIICSLCGADTNRIERGNLLYCRNDTERNLYLVLPDRIFGIRQKISEPGRKIHQIRQ